MKEPKKTKNKEPRERQTSISQYLYLKPRPRASMNSDHQETCHDKSTYSNVKSNNPIVCLKRESGQDRGGLYTQSQEGDKTYNLNNLTLERDKLNGQTTPSHINLVK